MIDLPLDDICRNRRLQPSVLTQLAKDGAEQIMSEYGAAQAADCHFQVQHHM